MKTLIVCVSVSHGNTRKIAATMADVLEATVLDPEELDVATVADYDLVGFEMAGLRAASRNVSASPDGR